MQIPFGNIPPRRGCGGPIQSYNKCSAFLFLVKIFCWKYSCFCSRCSSSPFALQFAHGGNDLHALDRFYEEQLPVFHGWVYTN